jgi:hypothetical protein
VGQALKKPAGFGPAPGICRCSTLTATASTVKTTDIKTLTLLRAFPVVFHLHVSYLQQRLKINISGLFSFQLTDNEKISSTNSIHQRQNAKSFTYLHVYFFRLTQNSLRQTFNIVEVSD